MFRLLVVLLSLAAVTALWRVDRLAVPYAGPPAWSGSPAFQGEGAWRAMVALATRYPRRWSGGPDRAAAADWIAGQLAAAGLRVSRHRFSAHLGTRAPVALENVWGTSLGTDRRDDVVVAVGNYDMAPTSYQAASDTAGHVGTLLELARLWHSRPHRRTFIFLFVDGEEWGMLGARHFVRTFAGRERIVAAVSIEDLDAGRLDALGIDSVGQFHGFAPMWLRALAADAAAREGLPVQEVGPTAEWLLRAVPVSLTDQGPFLGHGVPAIDLAGRTADRALQSRIYHLPGDTVEKMRPASVAVYGHIQERILRALDGMDAPPRESAVYLRIGPDRVVPPWRVRAVQAAVFVPLLAAVLRRGLPPPPGISSETGALAAVMAVPLGALAVVKALPVLGLMRPFALYPPPPRHPLLTRVDWVPVGIAAGALAAAALVVWAGRRRGPRLYVPVVTPAARVLVLRVWLLVLAAAALVENGFAAVLFVGLPALLWVWVVPGGPVRRLVNAGLLAAGLVPVGFLVLRYGQVLGVGPYILWYLFMGAAYGQFTLARLTFAAALLGVAARFASATVLAGPRPL